MCINRHQIDVSLINLMIVLLKLYLNDRRVQQLDRGVDWSEPLCSWSVSLKCIVTYLECLRIVLWLLNSLKLAVNAW